MQKLQYKYITTLAMLYALTLLTCASLIHKFVIIGGHSVSAGSFIIPFWFIISDIITEVYGYKTSRKMLWNLLIVGFLAYGVLQLFVLIQKDTPPSGPAYYYVFGSMLRMYAAMWASLFFANFINTYLLAKLKIAFHSRHFWIRSIMTSSLGEILYTAASFMGILGGDVSAETMMWLIIWGCILKVVITILFSGLANYITTALKKAEGFDIYDTNINFNPFKFEL